MDETIPRRLRSFIAKHLTSDEQHQITEQLCGQCVPGRQVLWTGMTREAAQSWADEHDMQTLSTAMGPLMDAKSPHCPRQKKSANQWAEYVHGASAIFAWYISKGDLVTLLTNPPPKRFHPSGKTSIQTIEGPIIKGEVGNRAVRRIEVIHPSVPGATETRYQLWPHDETDFWRSIFCDKDQVVKWRKVKSSGLHCGFESAFGEVNSPRRPATEIEKTTAGSRKDKIEKLRVCESEQKETKALQTEQSKRMKVLQQQQTTARKQLHDKQLGERKLLQSKQCKKAGDASSHKQKEKKKERKRFIQDLNKQGVALPEKHKRERSELGSFELTQIKQLKKACVNEKAALQQRQGDQRRHYSERVKNEKDDCVQHQRQTEEFRTMKLAESVETGILTEKQGDINRLKEKRQKGEVNPGQDRLGDINDGHLSVFSQVGAGLRYLADLLLYSTKHLYPNR